MQLNNKISSLYIQFFLFGSFLKRGSRLFLGFFFLLWEENELERSSSLLILQTDWLWLPRPPAEELGNRKIATNQRIHRADNKTAGEKEPHISLFLLIAVVCAPYTSNWMYILCVCVTEGKDIVFQRPGTLYIFFLSVWRVEQNDEPLRTAADGSHADSTHTHTQKLPDFDSLMEHTTPHTAPKITLNVCCI